MYTISKDKIIDKVRLEDYLVVRAVMSYGDNILFGSYRSPDGSIILEYSKKR